MTKVFQQLIDKTKGDCMQCAIASLLDMKYEDVPRFIEYPNGYFEPLFNLIKSKGYKWRGMLHNPMDKTNVYEECFISQLHKYNGVDGHFYATVYSPKYFDAENFNMSTATTHAVLIDKNYNIVHDPNPENQDIKEYPLAKELGYNGIINVALIEKNGH